MREPLQKLSFLFAAILCCALPLLLIAGASLVGGLKWGKSVFLLIGLIVFSLVLGSVALSYPAKILKSGFWRKPRHRASSRGK